MHRPSPGRSGCGAGPGVPAGARHRRTAAAVASRGLAAGRRIAVVAVELHAVEGDHQDLAPARVDGAGVLVDVGDGEGEVGAGWRGRREPVVNRPEDHGS